MLSHKIRTQAPFGVIKTIKKNNARSTVTSCHSTQTTRQRPHRRRAVHLKNKRLRLCPNYHIREPTNKRNELANNSGRVYREIKLPANTRQILSIRIVHETIYIML